VACWGGAAHGGGRGAGWPAGAWHQGASQRQGTAPWWPAALLLVRTGAVLGKKEQQGRCSSWRTGASAAVGGSAGGWATAVAVLQMARKVGRG
jgi:hypothetical protein